MHPTRDADGSMTDDVVDVVHLDVDVPVVRDTTLATVLAARCHVTLLEAAGHDEATLADEVENLREVLTSHQSVRRAAGRRRVERALSAVRTGRTGRLADDDVPTLIADLRVLEASMRSDGQRGYR